MKVAAATTAAAGLLFGETVAAAAVGVLWLGWYLLRVDRGVPVLFVAFTFQWLQVSSGYFYHGLTGRTLEAIYASDYRTMMWLSYGCLLAFAAGIHLGYAWLARRTVLLGIDRPLFNEKVLVVLYMGATVVTTGVQELAWRYPNLTQPILAFTFVRLALMYLVMRRLAAPRLRAPALFAVVVFEVILGLTGFFAGFREPIVLAALAVIEGFDRRRALHWGTVGILVVSASIMGLLWLGIRGELRKDFATVEMFSESREMRLERVRELSQGWVAQDAQAFWWNLDMLIERMWPVYYPALAVQRVPGTVSHTNGTLMTEALAHVFMPRVLFPDKPDLRHESDLVRRYSGVWVAGADEGTTIAFGYAAESYVDFGVPLMFLPSLLWGVFIGIAYRAVSVLIRHREIMVPVLAVIFWTSCYLFERSWAKTMGVTGTMLIYVGAVAYLLDHFMLDEADRQELQSQRERDAASRTAA